MTREEAIQVLSQRPMIAPSQSNKQKMFEEATDMAIEALKGGDAEMTSIPTGTGEMQHSPNNGADLISRADAIEAVKNTEPIVRSTERNWGKMIAEEHSRALVKELKALPSADAVHGEWEHWGSPFSDESEVIDTIVCSVCGARFIEPKDEPKGEYNFCPSCGARMDKGGDDE